MRGRRRGDPALPLHLPVCHPSAGAILHPCSSGHAVTPEIQFVAKGDAMRRLLAIQVCLALMAVVQPLRAQHAKPAGTVFIPKSSIRQAQPLISGFEGESKAFTNVALFMPAIKIEPMAGSETAPPAPYFVETPASIACVYGLVPKRRRVQPERRPHECERRLQNHSHRRCLRRAGDQVRS